MLSRGLSATLAMILQVILISWCRNLFETLKQIWVFKCAITLVMHSNTALSTCNHVLLEICCYLVDVILIHLTSWFKVRPKTFTDLATLFLLPFEITVWAKLKVLWPFLGSILAGFTLTALLTLNASFTMKLEFSRHRKLCYSTFIGYWFREHLGHWKFHVRVHAFIVIGRVATFANK